MPHSVTIINIVWKQTANSEQFGAEVGNTWTSWRTSAVACGAHRLVPVDGEGLRGDGVLALVAAEAIAMPLHIHGHHRRIRDGLLAFGAPGGEEVLVVLLAVGLAVLLVERLIGQRLLAGSAATEAFLVPTLAHGADGPLEDGLLAAGTGGGVPLHEALYKDKIKCRSFFPYVHRINNQAAP